MTTDFSVLIAGGGTGGHLFPGIAVAEELRRRVRDVSVSFVGTARGIESRVLPKLGEQLDLLDVSPLQGRTPVALLESLMKLPTAYGRALSILAARKPAVVLGVGGYASGPMLLAAWTRGIPIALLEQNAVLGLTNRVLAPLVGRAYLTFDATASTFGPRARVVGNPVRRSFVDATRLAQTDPEGFEARARKILVIGGSQGAKKLNEAIPRALARLAPAGSPYEIVHQTGAAMYEEVAAEYASLGVSAEVVPVIDDMARAYAGAMLVVARAGATTLAELTAVGRPSVLVPYPFAAEDHQSKNAEELARAGAAIAIREDQLDDETLDRALGGLLGSPDRRRAMAAAARRLGRPDAAAAVVDDLFGWLAVSGASTTGETPAAPPPDGSLRLVAESAPRATIDFRAGRDELILRRAPRSPVPPARLVPLRRPRTLPA
jgi:UDP-N-acetylglucosamine--N-acetylmuramyl-(pentapeptide) pyrophosphoryl-undecaprenol N-acetylglucosamine transferase